MIPQRFKVLAALITVYIAWGSTYLAIHFGIRVWPDAFSFAGIRHIISGTILLIYALIQRYREKKANPKAAFETFITLRQIRNASIIGVLLFVGGNGGVVFSEKGLASGLVSVLVSLNSVAMTSLEWAKTKKRPANSVLLGLAVAICGIVVLVNPVELFSGSGHRDTNTFTYVCIMLLAVLAWSSGSLISKYAETPKSTSLAVAVESLAGGTAHIIIAALNGEFAQMADPNSKYSRAPFIETWGSLFFLVVVGSLIGLTSYIWLISNATIAVASSYSFVNPLLAVFLGAIVLGERLSLFTALGAFCITCGVVIITMGRALAARRSSSLLAIANLQKQKELEVQKGKEMQDVVVSDHASSEIMVAEIIVQEEENEADDVGLLGPSEEIITSPPEEDKAFSNK